jgi:tetratricopeptide (TPR) repeat protein
LGDISSEININPEDLKSKNLDNALTYFLRGISYEDSPNALDEYNKAIEFLPNFLAARYRKALLLQNEDRKDPDIALSVLSEYDLLLASEFFQIPCVYYRKGIAYNALGEKRLARHAFTNAIVLAEEGIRENPDNVYAYDLRIAANHELGNNVLALFDLIKLKLMDPEQTNDLDLEAKLKRVMKALARQLIIFIPFILVGIHALRGLSFSGNLRTHKSKKK